MPTFGVVPTPFFAERRSLRRVLWKMDNAALPEGTIAESVRFAYGYNGDYYYVTESHWEVLVTKIHLKLDEAKTLFESLDFAAVRDIDTRYISKAIREARRARLDGDARFWFFENAWSKYCHTQPPAPPHRCKSQGAAVFFSNINQNRS